MSWVILNTNITMYNSSILRLLHNIGEKIMSEETKEKIGEIIGGIVFGLIGWAVFYQYFFIGG